MRFIEKKVLRKSLGDNCRAYSPLPYTWPVYANVLLIKLSNPSKDILVWEGSRISGCGWDTDTGRRGYYCSSSSPRPSNGTFLYFFECNKFRSFRSPTDLKDKIDEFLKEDLDDRDC
jgi:hypothetical protein